jgi:predicted nuclease of predicted toxin-antitoxin system
MKFVIDMNLTPRWASFLASYGWDAIHWHEVGPVNATDREICAWAATHGCIVMTNDLDFPQILASTQAGSPSLVLLRGQPLTPEARGSGLALAIKNSEEELTKGAVATLTWSDQFRVRLLPLR